MKKIGGIIIFFFGDKGEFFVGRQFLCDGGRNSRFRAATFLAGLFLHRRGYFRPMEHQNVGEGETNSSERGA